MMSLLDPRCDEARRGYEVLVEGGTIREVSDKPVKASGARVVDCGGRTLMPGLIDCHVHIYLVELGLHRLESMPLTLMAAKASVLLRQAMLDRGFTTVRDTGGADWGIKEAVETGVIAGPRLFISGRPISMTGGHGDSRRRTAGDEPCKCCNALSFVLETADGADGVRKAVREQMRQGADQIKIFVSGGVASPWDPLDSLQYSEAEIAGAVEEAHNFGRYVSGACLYAGSHHAGGAQRRADDRARQSDRRRVGAADGGAQVADGGEPHRLLRDARARAVDGVVGRHAGQE